MRYVLRRATGAGSSNPMKPKPRTGAIPFEIRGAIVRSGGPGPLIQDLQITKGLKDLFPEKVVLPLKIYQIPSTIRMNGIGSFVPSINKLTFLYNIKNRRSDLLMLYIQTILPTFAKDHPYIEICVAPTTEKPDILALYSSGKIKQLDPSRFDLKGILRAVEELSYQKGNNPTRISRPVISYTRDVDPIWNPFHARPDEIFKP